MDPSGQRHVSQETSPKSKRGGRGQNDELCKPDSGTEFKVQRACALAKSPRQLQGHVKRSCLSIMVMESTNEKWVMSKEVCQQSYGLWLSLLAVLFSEVHEST